MYTLCEYIKHAGVKEVSIKSLRNSVCLLGLIILGCLVLSGCSLLEKKQVLSPVAPVATPPPLPPVSPLAEIEKTFAQNDYTKVEILGKRLLEDSTLSQTDKARAAQLYAVSAMRNNHPHAALIVLEAWRTHSPQADQQRDWQEVWCNSVAMLPSVEARTTANNVYQDSSRSPVVRGVAAIAFAVRQWEDGELGETMAALEYVYNASPDAKNKATYEGRLASLLTQASHSAVGLIADSVTDDNYTSFPYNIILVDQLRRQLDNPQTRPQAQAALAELQNSVSLVDKSLLQGPPVPVQFESHVATSVPAAGQTLGNTIVLVLPRSGQMSLIVDKIVDGAQVAATEMGSTVLVIDTEQTGWLEQVRALPANSVIGGFIRPGDYAAIKSGKVTSSNVVFAFQSTLPGGDEGQVAWRFFSSPEDQIKTLVDFTASTGVKQYLSLYPDEAYGKRMNQLFESQVAKSGGTVTSSKFTPGQGDGWSKLVGSLFANAAAKKYQAVFIPDTLKNVDSLLPAIRYYNQGDQIIMGTSLWEQALSGAAGVGSPANYAYAVFPGSWNGATPSADGARLQASMKQYGKTADFWNGLGYDFARFANAFRVEQGWSPSSVNSALASFSMGWSMAPLYWDNSGRVSQQMFLFKPHETFGYAPIDRGLYAKVVQ